MKKRLALALFVPLLACADPTGPTTAISGEKIYEQYCARCHGLDGAGVPELPATTGRLNTAAVMNAKSDEQVLRVIAEGKPPAMPGFGAEFTEAKLMVLVAYVRSLSQPSKAPEDSGS